MSIPDQAQKPIFVLSQMGSFESLFKQHYPFVCTVIFKYVADKSKVEDIAQEIFTELWIKRDQIQIHTSLPAYLRRMSVSRALNYLRDTKKYQFDDLDLASDALQEATIQEASAILQMEETEMKTKIDNAIDKLPEKCRIVFMMSRFDELSYAEIGQQLNISIKTVENQIGKALKHLRHEILDNRG